MLKLLTAEQIRQVDKFTIEHKPILSIDLMEKASGAFIEVFIKHFPDKKRSVAVYCGTGNNGDSPGVIPTE